MELSTIIAQNIDDTPSKLMDLELSKEMLENYVTAEELEAAISEIEPNETVTSMVSGIQYTNINGILIEL